MTNDVSMMVRSLPKSFCVPVIFATSIALIACFMKAKPSWRMG